jgi:hypothetical protein
MKKPILSVILVIIVLNLNLNAQDQQMPKNAIRLDQTILKDESGNIIDMQKFAELMNSGNWAINPVKNTSGEILYVQLRRMTEEEKIQNSSKSESLPGSDLVGKKAPDFKMKASLA